MPTVHITNTVLKLLTKAICKKSTCQDQCLDWNIPYDILIHIYLWYMIHITFRENVKKKFTKFCRGEIWKPVSSLAPQDNTGARMITDITLELTLTLITTSVLKLILNSLTHHNVLLWYQWNCRLATDPNHWAGGDTPSSSAIVQTSIDEGSFPDDTSCIYIQLMLWR